MKQKLRMSSLVKFLSFSNTYELLRLFYGLQRQIEVECSTFMLVIGNKEDAGRAF